MLIIPSYLKTGAEVVGSLLVLFGVGVTLFLMWRFALLKGQSEAMKVQADTIKALNDRIDQLETDRLSDRAEIDRLRGVVEGRERAMVDLVEAIAEAKICENAPGCPNRRQPTF